MPGIIKVNPSVFEDKRDALAVAFNEAIRLMQEDMKFTPVFEVTPEQKAFFKNTAYATDSQALKRTIISRIATHDTSVSPTPEQEMETVRLLALVMEMIGPKHPDFPTVAKMAESVKAGGARGEVRAAPAPEAPVEEGGAPMEQQGVPETVTTQAADAAGDVRAAAPVTTSVKARALNYIKGAKPEMEAVVDRVVAALVPAEGFADNDTVGDKGKAVGTLQMWDVAVAEANRIVGRDLWTSEDRKDPMRARAMAKVTLSYHYRRGVTDPVELGSKWRNPFSVAPEWYKAKIREALVEK